MQVVFHTGAHCTDEDRLIKCLLRNREELAPIGTIVPPPGRYRKLLHRTFLALSHAEPAPDARELLIDAILEGEDAERLLLSNENFFCIPGEVFAGDELYTRASQRVGLLKKLFHGDELELFFAIRDPATFIPALEQKAPKDYHDLIRGADPMDLRWSDLIMQLRSDHPDVPITVWCNEDTPLIWAQVIRDIAGLNPGQKIRGGFDLLAEVMTREGMKRFRAYLKQHPDMTEIQKRRVMVAFLDKFARDDVIDEEIDLPGWTDVLLDQLTENYDEDVFALSRIPGVTVIAP